MNLRSTSYSNGVRPFQVLWVSTASKGRFGPETHLFFWARRHVIVAEIVWLQKRPSRDARHFMVTKHSISSALRSPLKDELCYYVTL